MKKFPIFVFLVVFVLTVIYQYDKFSDKITSDSNRIKITQIDPVSMSVDAIKHQGKLVVADVVLHAEVQSKMESSVFDAKVMSSSKAKAQVWLDLSKVSKDWVQRDADHLKIVVPFSAISSDHITVSSEDQDNSSMGFFFYGSVRDDLKKKNHLEIDRSISVQEEDLRNAEAPLIAAQLGRLFQTILSSYNIKVDVMIDKTK